MATDVAASLPELILPPGSTITVTFDDAAANVTKLNVFGFTPAGDETGTIKPYVPLFTYGARL